MGFVRDIFGGDDAADAAKDAANIQSASSQAGIDELRRQFDFTNSLLGDFVNAGSSQQNSVLQGASAQGLDQRLAEIFNTDIFKNLSSQRVGDAENLFSQRGLSRSGGAIDELSKIPINTGLAIESDLFNRQNSIFSSGQNAAAGLGAAGQQTGSAIANLLNQSGDAQAQGIIGGAQANAAATQSGINTALGLGSLFFSDPRLKDNMKPIKQIGSLTLYKWDWKDFVPDQFKHMTIGFNAEEVDHFYPDFIHSINGVKAIDYPSLINHLEAA